MSSIADCLAGFYHRPVTTMSMHVHVYRYPLFKSETKGL